MARLEMILNDRLVLKGGAILALVVAILYVAPDAARGAGACDAPRYHAFDFFLGRWNVRNAAGKLIGTDVVDRELGGCMLVERYADAGDPGKGYGITGLRAGSGIWEQTFMDDSGALLTFDGHRVGAIMHFDGTDFPKPGVKRLHRVDFIPMADGRIEERWEASRDHGETWKSVFDGYFSKA